MTKFQLMLTSLVAVLPAALLCVVLGLAVLNHTLPVMAYVVVGITLAVGAVTVLMPLGIVVGGGGRRAAAAKPAAKKQVSEEVAVIDDEVEVEDAGPLSAVAASEDDVEAAPAEFDLGSDAELEEEGHLVTEAEVETEPLEDFDHFEMESEGDDLADIELNFDDEEEEEEVKPKKKKKR